MRTRISFKIQSLLNMLQAPDVLEGLKAKAMTWIQGSRTDLIDDTRIKCIPLEPRFTGLVLQALGAAKNGCSKLVLD